MVKNRFEEEASTASADKTDLETVEALANRQVGIEKDIEEKEIELKVLKSNLKQVSQIDLPNAMDSVGMVSLELESGFSVVIKDGVDAGITKKNKDAAHKWLNDNGFGDIIKNEVKVLMPRGDTDLANELDRYLTKIEVPFDSKESVHGQTLKAFVKERLRQGEAFPADLLGVFEYRHAKLTLRK